MGNKFVVVAVFLVLFQSVLFATPAMIKSTNLKMVDSKGKVVTKAKNNLKKVETTTVVNSAKKNSSNSSISADAPTSAEATIPKNAYELALTIARAKKDDKANSSFVALTKKDSKSKKDNKTQKTVTPSKKDNKSQKITNPLSSKSIKLTSIEEKEEAKPNAIKVTRNAVVEVRKERGKEPQLRVKLGNVRPSIKISFPSGGNINDSNNKRLRKLKENEEFIWNCKQTINSKDKKNSSVPYIGKKLIFKPLSSKNGIPEKVTIDGKTYRGSLTVSFTKNGAIVINNLGMEDYLRGVIGREIGIKSPKESLKAQTVIARTYAYRFIDRHKSDEADVCDTTHCQAYVGVAGEADSVNEAINETKGQIITYQGKPIEALYHATCGGYTSDNTKVFGGVRDYLKRVKCEYCIEGTMYRWNRSFPLAELRKALAKDDIRLDSEIIDIKYESQGYMDRVDNVVFIGKKHTTKVKGTKIRSVFNLPSTTFVVAERKKNIEKILKNSSKEYQNEKKTGIIITEVTQNIARQYMVMTDQGLKRVQMPQNGWDTIIWTDSPIQKKEKPVNKPLLETLELFGRGFGHQVGLCQSGAVGLGKKGWSYREIIGLYYTGVTLYYLGYR